VEGGQVRPVYAGGGQGPRPAALRVKIFLEIIEILHLNPLY
jgi:hypothetical protein